LDGLDVWGIKNGFLKYYLNQNQCCTTPLGLISQVVHWPQAAPAAIVVQALQAWGIYKTQALILSLCTLRKPLRTLRLN
jgi:hypothetical protein